jgi:hypothetical protein
MSSPTPVTVVVNTPARPMPDSVRETLRNAADEAEHSAAFQRREEARLREQADTAGARAGRCETRAAELRAVLADTAPVQ